MITASDKETFMKKQFYLRGLCLALLLMCCLCLAACGKTGSAPQPAAPAAPTPEPTATPTPEPTATPEPSDEPVPPPVPPEPEKLNQQKTWQNP